MKKTISIILLGICIVLSVSNAFADTNENLLKEYKSAFLSCNWERIASNVNEMPDDIIRPKDNLCIFFSQDDGIYIAYISLSTIIGRLMFSEDYQYMLIYSNEGSSLYVKYDDSDDA